MSIKNEYAKFVEGAVSEITHNLDYFQIPLTLFNKEMSLKDIEETLRYHSSFKDLLEEQLYDFADYMAVEASAHDICTYMFDLADIDDIKHASFIVSAAYDKDCTVEEFKNFKETGDEHSFKNLGDEDIKRVCWLAFSDAIASDSSFNDIGEKVAKYIYDQFHC